ncbi:GntR family transcriptional regulator [Paraburkholderia sp. BR10954]|uniref:GntR family transcriptional regulator n=1 Tax=Paraburkholderia sp. BR10954 TaxID=3236995 RepID=UPI0034D2FE97
MDPMDAAAFAETGSASDAVFFGVISGLENQTFVPGQRLVEGDLATTFGVSRNSVREGLQRLVAEGVVDLLRHKGGVIRSLSVQDTLDVLDVAELMTGLLARAAARMKPAAAQARVIEQIIGDLNAADEARDVAGFSMARRRFYRALLELGGNDELRRLFPAIHMPIVYAQYRLPSLQQLRLRDYGRIAAAVLAGEADKAEALGREHVQNVRRCICGAEPAVMR